MNGFVGIARWLIWLVGKEMKFGLVQETTGKKKDLKKFRWIEIKKDYSSVW